MRKCFISCLTQFLILIKATKIIKSSKAVIYYLQTSKKLFFTLTNVWHIALISPKKTVKDCPIYLLIVFGNIPKTPTASSPRWIPKKSSSNWFPMTSNVPTFLGYSLTEPPALEIKPWPTRPHCTSLCASHTLFLQTYTTKAEGLITWP